MSVTDKVYYRGARAVALGFIVFACCSPAAAADVCDFYQQKLESKLACGANGYPLAYGKRYCERFRDLQNLSAAGTQWRDRTLACLQRELEKYATNGGDCAAVRDDAFASHSPCYTKSGFCNLTASDYFKVFQTIDWRDMMSAKGLEQIGATLRDCYNKKIESKELDPNSVEAKRLLLIITALESGKAPTA